MSNLDQVVSATTATEPGMRASDLLARTLENEGVEYIFGVPGEENLDFLESLRTSKIRLILTRHEQAAGFMAATYGRLTGKAGVCLATLGPGATNLVTAAAYAQLGAMPMMMITGQKPIKASKQGRFQIVDVVAMMRPITKFAKQIVNGNTIPSVVREAFRLAEEERPGAVHIELPEDIAAERVDDQLLFVPTSPRRPICDDVAINQAAASIQAAKHPLLLVGAGANRKRIIEALETFVGETGIPYFNTHMWTAPSSQGVLQCFDQIACVHMSGLFVRSHMNAGQDGSRDESSKQMGDLIEGHWEIRSFSRHGSIDHTICSSSCKFWHQFSTVAVVLLPVSG